MEKARPSSREAYAVVCGPPVMIKFTLPVLRKLGFPADWIYTTLENRMKCGPAHRVPGDGPAGPPAGPVPR